MSRILWLGDAGVTTGFAQVTHQIGERLVTRFGHDVHVLAVNHKGDHVPTNLKLYVPTMLEPRDTWGRSRFVEMLGKVMPDVVISLNDPVVLLHHLFRNDRDPGLALARYAPILAYLPVDGANYPDQIQRLPELVGNLAPLEGAMTDQPTLVPVVMAEHGNTVFPDAPLVYHGVDTDMFRPPTERSIAMSNGTVVRSKADAKRALGLPAKAKLIVRVDRNSLRKNFADTYKALAPIMQRDPDVHVWFHCRPDDPAGVDLNLLLTRDMSIADRFHGPKELSNLKGWQTEDLVAVYAAADLFVSTSAGEGFGLTLAEAAACEVPIVAMNVSAIPEVVGPGGVLLEPAGTTVPLSGQDNWLPDVSRFTDEIAHLLSSAGARRSLGQAGRAHVKQFTWDAAAARFDELIKQVSQKPSGALATGGAS